MHRMVATVFKILILSTLFMFLLDTTLLLTEIISINSRITNIAGTMQNEIARNNCMPSALEGTFISYLRDIEKNSTIMSGKNTLSDIKINLTENINIGGKTFTALTPDKAGDYGDFVTLAIEAKLHPDYVYFNAQRSDGDTGFLMRANPFDISINYIYNVPCLRYLK